jgi:amino acid adenylation domain-containing protein
MRDLREIKVAAGQNIKERDYWRSKLFGEPVKSSFAYDDQETTLHSRTIEEITSRCDGPLFAQLMEVSKHKDHALHIILVTALVALLNRYTGREDIIVGTPIYRQANEGEFINTALTIRNQVNPDISFKELLVQVKQTVLEAVENQAYPVELLPELLNIPVLGDEFPLFDTALLLENIHDKRYMDHIALNMVFRFLRTNKNIEAVVEYNASLYQASTVERIFSHFTRLMENALPDLDLAVFDIEILSEEEKNQLLVNFNDTGTEYPADKTIHQLFEEQAEKRPGNIAVVGTGHGAWGMVSLTYSELNRKSNQLAYQLMEKGVGPDTIVGIMAERSIEMVIGVLAILKAGGAYLPIDPDYPGERIRFILADSEAKILLITRVLSEKITIKKEMIYLEDYKKPCPGEISSRGHEKQPAASSLNLAYILYTSGSTGRPKGVMVEHRNVVRLVQNTNYIAFSEELKILQTGALEFDASTFEIWGSLLNSATLYLVDKDRILMPRELKAILQKYKITTLWMTASLFNHMLEEDLEIFRGISHLLVGGEVLSPVHIKRVRQQYPGLDIINGYGPTENTTFSTTFQIDREYHRSIPIGKPIANSTAYILKGGYLVPMGAPGELVVGGDGVSRGYLNNPELTNEKFVKNPFVPGDRMYKTGDLAQWLPKGNIEFLGRIDQQVKIRGFRIELGEIENQLLRHQDVKGAVVIPRSDETGDKFLCAYIVSAEGLKKTPDAADLTEFLSHTLPDYMIPVYFVPLEKLPLTPNGKVDRKALPAPDTGSGRRYVEPRNPVEEKLADAWSQVLGITRDSIGIDDNFFQLGGHSLKATILLSRIHKEFGVQMAVSDMFKMPDIRKLSQYIEEAAKELYIPIKKTEEKEYYALSPAQARLYILNRMKLDSTGYNLAAIYLLEIAPDFPRLRKAFEKLIERHESFRTSFRMVDDQMVQKIHKEVPFEIEYYDLSSEGRSERSEVEEVLRDLIRPFDLSEAPLLRVGLIKKENNEHILLMDMHHIIVDGLSLNILEEELAVLYEPKQVPPLKLQYKDCCEWQRREWEKENIKAQKEYWLKTFEGEIPVLYLPNDFPRPSEQNFEGDTFYFELGGVESEALMRVAGQEGVTLFMMLLAIYTILLAKLSSQDDIVVGSPASGRCHVDMEPVIGMFVNTLVIRTQPMASKKFKEFLSEVRAVTLVVFENQEYQFEELVENVMVNRDLSRSPLFDVMFVLEDIKNPESTKQELILLPFKYRYDQSKFDLTLFARQSNAALSFTVEYSTQIFKEKTIQRFVRYFKRIISEIIDTPEKKLLQIELISPEEKSEILYDFNDTSAEYPSEKTIHQLFEEQVEKTPDNIAVIAKSTERRAQNGPDGAPEKRCALTYRELNRESNQLAHLLRSTGVDKGEIVGLMVERSLEMVKGLLGILKAGGAYLPLDPDYPEERKKYLLKDSNAKVLLKKSEIRMPNIDAALQSSARRSTGKNPNDKNANDPNKISSCIVLNFEHLDFESVLVLRSGLLRRVASDFEFRVSNLTSSNLAYVLYTSGTTGQPKGVMVDHRNVVRLVKNTNYVVFKEGGRILQTGALEFDASTFEIWGALLNGWQLHLAGKDDILVPERLKTIIRENNITTMWMTSPLFNQMLQADMQIFAGLKNLLVGGDVLSLPHINKLRKGFPDLNIINGYGPTENTTFSTTFSIKKEYTHSIPIGSPISNSTVYIVDKDNHLVPVGTYGEILVGGDGVARGYLNNPDLTAEKFNRSYKSYMTYISYRTGDRGRWLLDGNIEFLGRIDQQVKIRGFRIELEEIENQLLKHKDIKEVVILAFDNQEGDKYLAAYVVFRPSISLIEDKTKKLREYLSGKLPDFMVPSFFTAVEKIPLTLNGKVDRSALPKPGSTASDSYIPPRNETEKKLALLWAEILGIEIETIGIDSNFFTVGGHSLRAVKLIARIHKEFSVLIPISVVFKGPSIRNLSKYIDGAVKERYTSIEQSEKKEYYAASSIQKRLFILSKMGGIKTSYNLVSGVFIEGEVNPHLFERIFQLLIRRHESLRTSFTLIGDEPVQIVHENVDFHINSLEADASEIDQVVEEFIAPFDLGKAPLLRASLIKISERKYLFLYDMHHIISDGTSIGIFLRDFMRLYEAKGSERKLPELRVQYKDFSEWQNNTRGKARPDLEKKENYWLDRFRGEIPRLDIYTDYPRPAVQSFEGDRIIFTFEKELHRRINQFMKVTNTTLYMVLLAVYNILLARYTGQEDITVGTPAAGREHGDFENIVGIFINPLPMRNYPQRNKTFKEFLNEVKLNTINAYENQAYPFGNLVEKVAVTDDLSRNPIFETELLVQNIEMPEWEIEGLRFLPYEFRYGATQVDIAIEVWESDEKISFNLIYCTRLFKRGTMERFAISFREILSTVLDNPNIGLNDIKIARELLTTQSDLYRKTQTEFKF